MTVIPDGRRASGPALLSADRATTWQPGVTYNGGIPNRTTIFTTINASTYGNGSSEASAGIQTAIDSCPVGQVVLLSSGTFLCNNYVLVNKGISLRGAGPESTFLQKTNGGKAPIGDKFTWDSYQAASGATDAQPLIIIGPGRFGVGPDNSTAVNLSSDAVKGTFSVVVASATGLAAGQYVMLDEDNYTTATFVALPTRNAGGSFPQNSQIKATDRITWQMHNPSDFYDDPGAASSWFSRDGRPVAEMKKIASVSGTTITFTTPIHITYRTSHTAQITRFGATAFTVQGGVEELAVIGGGSSNIQMNTCAECWVKHVDSSQYDQDPGIFVNNSFRAEIRDSYLHDGSWPEPGGAGYSICLSNGSADCLIENCISVFHCKTITCRAAGAGSVVAYCYMDNAWDGDNANWMEVAVNGSHMVGCHHMLFEGNQGMNYDCDNTHGSSIYHTAYRNHFIGARRDQFRSHTTDSYTAATQNIRCIGLAQGCNYHSFIGNVLGQSGLMSGFNYQDLGTVSSGEAWLTGASVWKLGYDPIHWEQHGDPVTIASTQRDGNWDYLTNSVHWDNPAQALPNSLYAPSKPAFFGSSTWPWVDPIGATKLFTLPARVRFDAGTPNTL